MGNQRVIVGACLFVALAIAAIITALTAHPPIVVVVLLLILGAATLGALGLWAAGHMRRTAMRVAAGTTAVAALLYITPALSPDSDTSGRWPFVLFIVAAIVAVVLVLPELGGRSEASPGARTA
jgi:hypothetical protein